MTAQVTLWSICNTNIDTRSCLCKLALVYLVYIDVTICKYCSDIWNFGPRKYSTAAQLHLLIEYICTNIIHISAKFCLVERTNLRNFWFELNVSFYIG